MKNKLLILIFLSIITADSTGGGLSFLNIAPTSKMNSLGNTMFSGLGDPSSILFNPANSWSISRYKFSVNNVWYNESLDAQVNHLFMSFKLKKSSQSLYSLGFIQYGVDNIEEYNNEADFQDYFSFSDLAFLLGYSYRTSNIYWGISSALISENFSNIDYDRTYFYQYDIGVSLVDFPITNTISFSSGISIKNVFNDKFESQNSMNNNNIIGTMMSYNSLNSNFTAKGYFDILFQKILDVYSGRFGFELGYNIKDIQTSLCLGYNDFRLTSLDTFSLLETNEYNSQLKWGIGIGLPFKNSMVQIFMGQAVPGKSIAMDSKFITITLTGNPKF